MGKVDGLFILVAVILVLFGAKKLPELARNVGESVGELKKGLNSTPSTTTSKPEATNEEK